MSIHQLFHQQPILLKEDKEAGLFNHLAETHLCCSAVYPHSLNALLRIPFSRAIISDWIGYPINNTSIITDNIFIYFWNSSLTVRIAILYKGSMFSLALI